MLLSCAFWKGAEIGTLSSQRCVFEWEHSGPVDWADLRVRNVVSLSLSHSLNSDASGCVCFLGWGKDGWFWSILKEEVDNKLTQASWSYLVTQVEGKMNTDFRVLRWDTSSDAGG